MGRGRHRRYRHLNIFIVYYWSKDLGSKEQGFLSLIFVPFNLLSSINNDILLKEVIDEEKTTDIVVFVLVGFISIATVPNATFSI
jgi:hypothetical protein